MSNEIKSQMPARVISILAKVGDVVSPDTEIMTVESMKMEMPVIAEFSGTIESINVSEGDSVAKDGVLAIIK